MLTTPRVPCLKYLTLSSSPCTKKSQSSAAAMEATAANEPDTKSSNSSPGVTIPNFFVSLSSAFTQTPSVRTNKPSLRPLPPASDSVKLIQDFHRSLLSATEKFAGFVHSLAAKNPLFREAVRLSSEFRGVCDEVIVLQLLFCEPCGLLLLLLQRMSLLFVFYLSIRFV